MAGSRTSSLFFILLALPLVFAAPVAQRADIPGRDDSRIRSSFDGAGTVYVRWGNDVCLGNSEMLYKGYTGGSLVSVSGGAANYLCLPSHPEFAPHQPPSNVYGPSLIYGTEYEVWPEPQNNHESLCAVCWSPRSASVMIPAANVCNPGWTLEYSGFIMSGYPAQGRPSSEYICVDSRLEDRHQGGVADDNQAFLYFTRAKCGSLPCPPYVEDKVLGCVVCTK